MKGFERKNQLFSLCGLNCGLCPMLLGNYCGGCGNGNQSCRIAKCSLEHGNIEYCYECRQYPCEKYQHIDDYDSFITHKRRKADLERAKTWALSNIIMNSRKKHKFFLTCFLTIMMDVKNILLCGCQFIRTFGATRSDKANARK